MPRSLRRYLPQVIFLALISCFSSAALLATEPVRELTILYTNDFHSAFDPIPAYWLPGSPKLGGAAQLGTLINQIRNREKTVFLFDTGDMFTGMLSNLTRGEALMEMMMTMRYDAMAIGNHEFDYGSDNFEKQMNPEVQRDFDEDIRLCGEVEGIDVFIGGHAHRGIETPFVHPKTGALIVQTYGYGTRLGYLKLRVSGKKIILREGELLKVWSDKLAPDPAVAAKVQRYKQQVAPVIGKVVGRSAVRLVRDYNVESLLGSFVADVMRKESGAEVAFESAGGLRADLPEGTVTNGNVLDALPFLNTLVVCEMTGAQIREVLEQGLSLERGLVQASGLRATYDLTRPIGRRLVELRIGGAVADDRRTYRVATNSFLAEGGDLYQTFLQTKQKDTGTALSDLVIEYFRKHGLIARPTPGRLVPVAANAPQNRNARAAGAR